MKRLFVILPAVLLLSGCSLSSDETEEIPRYEVRDLSGGVIRSQDYGETYAPFVAAEEGKAIRKTQVYSMDFAHGGDPSLFFGSAEDGLFSDTGEGGVWRRLPFPPEKIYAFSAHHDDQAKSTTIYAAGVYESRGKIYKSLDGGENWKEIYTEPASGTVILALASHASDPGTVYAGTSEGVVIKSTDGGATWRNMQTFDQPVYDIALDSSNPRSVYFLLFERDVSVSRDGGETIMGEEDISKNDKEEGVLEDLSGKRPYSIAPDPNRSGVVYVGAQGEVFASEDFGATWRNMDIIESVEGIPIRSIGVSPFSSREIIFGAARAIYSSRNGGESWRTFQLDADATPAHIVFDPVREGTVYVGLRTF